MAKRTVSKSKASTYVRRRTAAQDSSRSEARLTAKAGRERDRYAALVDEVEADQRPRRVRGRKVALVSLADLRRLRELEREDREDAAAIEEAMRDPRPSVPWDSVKAELGL